jgi:hypothetical protein
VSMTAIGGRLQHAKRKYECDVSLSVNNVLKTCEADTEVRILYRSATLSAVALRFRIFCVNTNLSHNEKLREQGENVVEWPNR